MSPTHSVTHAAISQELDQNGLTHTLHNDLSCIYPCHYPRNLVPSTWVTSTHMYIGDTSLSEMLITSQCCAYCHRGTPQPFLWDMRQQVSMILQVSPIDLSPALLLAAG